MREGGVKEGGRNEGTGAIWEHCLLAIRCAACFHLLSDLIRATMDTYDESKTGCDNPIN